MFGKRGEKRREEKIQRLADAVQNAENALEGGGSSALELILAELADALIFAPDNPTDIGRHDPQLDALQRRAWKLHRQLEDALGEVRDRRVTPCPRCDGTEILVSDEASIENLIIGPRACYVPFTLMVCRACGDMRMTATDPSWLAQMNVSGAAPFRTVHAKRSPGGGPYR